MGGGHAVVRAGWAAGAGFVAFGAVSHAPLPSRSVSAPMVIVPARRVEAARDWGPGLC